MIDPDVIRACAAFVAVRRHKQAKARTARPFTNHRPLPEGWHKLGNGLFGEAWAIPGAALVLKISGPEGWGKGLEQTSYPAKDAWPLYAEHCLHNWRSCKHLPRVHHVQRISPTMTWGILERLDACARGDMEQADEWGDILSGYGDSPPEWMWPLRNMVESLRVCVDIHDGNIMRRPGTDTVVLTDPFSDVGSAYDGSADND